MIKPTTTTTTPATTTTTTTTTTSNLNVVPPSSLSVTNTPPKLGVIPSSTTPTVLKWEKNIELSATANDVVTRLTKLVNAERPTPENLPDVSVSNLPSFLDLDTPQQFYSWYQSLEEDIEQEKNYQFTLDEMKSYKEWCLKLLEDVEGALFSLKTIASAHATVHTKTGNLHQACQNLLTQESRLVSYAQSITDKLAIFNELDRLTRKFNSQNMSVLDEGFILLIKGLDECISFLETNSTFQESPSYLLKFRLLQNRGLTLIKTHIVQSFKTTTAQLSTQPLLPSTTTTTTTENTIAVFDSNPLFYVKFRALAAKLRPLCKELESRVNIREYSTLLQDCHREYFQQRLGFLFPKVYNHITQKIVKVNELTIMARSGCNYIIELCKLEHQLYHEFFEKPSSGLRTMLEEFCSLLYETLRPIYIHSWQLDLLCSLVDILRTEILEDKVQQQVKVHKGLSAFKPVVHRMLQDIQERLTFLAQTFIRDEILGYAPTIQDLDYPNKLFKDPAVIQVLSLTGVSNPLDTENANVENNPDPYAIWFPTLQRTLMCLSKLYLNLDPRIFEGLASESVESCIETLVRASRMLGRGKSTPLDSQLFLIKHLVRLREQIAPFDINFSITERGVDFGQMRSAIQKILTGKTAGSLFSLSSKNPLFGVVQSATPRVTDNQMDARKTLENELKKATQAFVIQVTSPHIIQLQSFLTKANAFLNTQKMQDMSPLQTTPASTTTTPTSNTVLHVPLWEQSFAKPEQINLLVNSVMESITRDFPEVVNKMKIYLPQHSIFLKPLKQAIIDMFNQVSQLLSKHYPPHESVSVRIPLPDQLTLLFDFWWSGNNSSNSTNSDNTSGSELSRSNDDSTNNLIELSNPTPTTTPTPISTSG